MAIRCDYVHRLELLKFYCCISYSEHRPTCPKLNRVPISRLTVKYTTQNLTNLRNSSLCTCSHLMAI